MALTAGQLGCGIIKLDFAVCQLRRSVVEFLLAVYKLGLRVIKLLFAVREFFLGIGELLFALGFFVIELGPCVIKLFLGVAVDPVIPLVRGGLDQVFPYRAQPVHLLFIRVGVNDLIGVQFYIDIRIVFGAEGLSGQIHEAVDGAVPDRCGPSLEIDIEG